MGRRGPPLTELSRSASGTKHTQATRSEPLKSFAPDNYALNKPSNKDSP